MKEEDYDSVVKWFKPDDANLGSFRFLQPTQYCKFGKFKDCGKKTRINLMNAIWECLSLWNKHDDHDDHDAIWESLKLQNKCLDFHFFSFFSNDMKKQIGCNLLKKK
jgi:hypothetical protein